MVAASSIPFSILVVPQVLQNYRNLASGNSAALAAISWVAWTSGLCGNLLMYTHFSDRGETTAVVVQAIGVLNNAAVLLQLWLAHTMPNSAFFSVAAILAAAVVINGSRMARLLPSRSWASGPSVWRVWQQAVGFLGVAALPQVLFMSCFPGSESLLPGLLAYVSGLLWFWGPAARGRNAEATDKALDGLPGWGATIFFALSPIPQLVRNFTNMSALEGLSIPTGLLGLLGNSLMIPRALFTRDLVWVCGTSWAFTSGWLGLLSLFLGTSAITGARFLQGHQFLALSCAMLGYAVFVLVTDARVKGMSSPAAALKDLASR